MTMRTPQSKPLVSVVVVTYDCINFIGPCIDSVLKSTYPNIEIIVIDNGSEDGTPVFVSKMYPNVTLVQTGKNLRYGRGNNIGIRKSRGEYILLLNPDTIVDHNYISELFAVESSDPSVAIAPERLGRSQQR